MMRAEAGSLEKRSKTEEKETQKGAQIEAKERRRSEGGHGRIDKEIRYKKSVQAGGHLQTMAV